MTRVSSERLRATALLASVGAAPLLLRNADVERAERAVLSVIVRRRPSAMATQVRGLTPLGEPPVVAGIVLAAAVWSRQRGVQPAVTVGVIIRAASGIALRRALAEGVRRGRPPQAWWWDDPSGFSYPSRHVTWAVLGYGAAADLVRAAGGASLARYVKSMLVGVVAITRVVLAVHWPSDVAGAIGFGAGWRRLSRS